VAGSYECGDEPSSSGAANLMLQIIFSVTLFVLPSG
jgi:hypothetical protein